MRNYQYNSRAVEQYSSRRKGQALLFVFFLLLIVGILGGALAIMWKAEIKTRGAEKKGLTAFYLAQAGIERAKVEAKGGALTAPSWSGPYSDLAGGVYYFYIQNIGGNNRLIRSRGEAYDLSGNTVAQKEIEVSVDISIPSQLSWSWRQR